MDGDGLKELLPLVSKPVRYLGQEINSIKKDPTGARLKFCLAFPDVYEVGMSHLGIQILYHILNMLDLSNIPFFSKDRDERFPLIIAGGPTAFNPAPVADFFDAIVIGDGEEVVLEICDLVLQWKEAKGKKEDLLKSLSQLDGVYIPSLHTDGQKVRKRLVPDLNKV